MFCNGRTTGHYFGIFASDVFCRFSLFGFKKICKSVKMVEIFEKGEIQCVFYVFVFDVPRKNGGKVNGELFVRNCRFERRFVDGL